MTTAKAFRTLLAVASVAAGGLAAAASPAHAAPSVHFDGSPGPAAPPDRIGPYLAVPFGDDTRAACPPASRPSCTAFLVGEVADPAGTIGFSTGLQHRQVPETWAEWSHGYTGDVYFHTGTDLVLTLPADTVGVYFYVAPNLYLRGVQATADDGTTSGVVPVDYTEARYFGFYATGGARLGSISLFVEPPTGGGPNAFGRGFAIGEFGIARAKAPSQSLPGVVTSSTQWSLRESLSSGPATTSFSFGPRPGVPLTGDWDGDGTKTPGSFSGGEFRLSNSNAAGAHDIVFTFGDRRGFPVAGDFDGDGRDDVAVFRNGTWQVRTAAGAVTTFSFGSGSWPATIPVAGDWDGDGIDGVGVYSAGAWSLRHTATAGPPDAGSFGWSPAPGAYPVVGDWNADGTDTIGAKAGTTWYLRNQSSPGPADTVFDFGATGDLPVVWALPRPVVAL